MLHCFCTPQKKKGCDDLLNLFIHTQFPRRLFLTFLNCRLRVCVCVRACAMHISTPARCKHLNECLPVYEERRARRISWIKYARGGWFATGSPLISVTERRTDIRILRSNKLQYLFCFPPLLYLVRLSVKVSGG